MIEVNVYAVYIMAGLSAASILFFGLWFFDSKRSVKEVRCLKRELKIWKDDYKRLEKDIDDRDDDNWKHQREKEIECDLAKYQKSHHHMRNLSYQVRDINRLLNTDNEEFAND